VQHEEITRYLNPTPEIVYINSINENILERLSGADFDSDTIMLTNNEIMLQAAKRNYEHFPVPTKLVEATNLKRKYTNLDKADLDIKTSVNKIGEIINLSQELNSILWDRLYHGASIEDVMELYCDIAQLDVMSNLEIDSAKRENPADNTLELKKLKEKYGMRDEKGRHIRPFFFQYVDEYKGYRDGYYIYIEEDGEYRKHDIVGTLKEANEIKADRENLSIEKGRMSYIEHETAMDYLEKAISRYQMSRWKSKDLLDFADCLIDSRTISGQLRSKQARDIVVMIQEAKRKIDGIWKSDQGNNAEKRNAADEIESELIAQISKLSLEQKTMYHLLKLLDEKDYTNIRKFLFMVLFQVHNGAFYELIRKRREPVYWLIEVSKGKGTTQIYDFEYIKSLDDNSEFCGNLDSFLKSTT
jgi:Trk K+ transport system NAD-binding subunit